MNYDVDKIKKLKEKIKNDPKFFVNEILGVQLWDKQIEIIESVRDNKFTVVKSGHGVGKTYCSACTVLWFLNAFRPSKVVTTAPTWHQVKSILWSDINKLHRTSKIPLGGELLQTQLKIKDEHFAIGLSTDEADKFQGIHSENILVLFDEALVLELISGKLVVDFLLHLIVDSWR